MSATDLLVLAQSYGAAVIFVLALQFMYRRR